MKFSLSKKTDTKAAGSARPAPNSKGKKKEEVPGNNIVGKMMDTVDAVLASRDENNNVKNKLH